MNSALLAWCSVSQLFRNQGRWLSWTLLLLAFPSWAATNVYLLGVPDYGWYYGCMGTASGNLMGYWDRHGMPNFYTGTLNSGVAPLTTTGVNEAMYSLWATKAGVDGRPANQPGHIDDYWQGFEAVEPDPYLTAGREEHPPDCLADFMGMNQLKWTNMAGECTGNIDGFAFVYWDTNGARRVNYQPTDSTGAPVPDVQAGLRAWTAWRGSDATVFSQLADFDPTKPTTMGFTFEDLKAEIEAGYPVLLFLQPNFVYSREVGGITNANPRIHSMLAYGYYISSGQNYVRYMTSWAQGYRQHLWNGLSFEGLYPVRGVLGYHPLPKIRNWSVSGCDLSLQWDGPASDLVFADGTQTTTNRVNGYTVEVAITADSPDFIPVSSVLLTNSFTITNCPSPAFVRVRMVKP